MALDFPSNPVNNQIYGNFYWDSSMSAWRATGTSVPTVPSGVVSQYMGTTAPSGYLMCNGQSVLVADYPALYAVIGYNYGGSGANFSLPDMQGRVPVGKASSGTFNVSLTSAAIGGAESVTLTAAQSGIPTHQHANTLSNGTVASSTHRHDFGFVLFDKNWSPAGEAAGMGSAANAAAGAYRYSTGVYQGSSSIGSFTINVNSNVNSGTFTSQSTGRYRTTGDTDTPSSTTTVGITNVDNVSANASQAHTNLQPYIVVNYIIKT